MKTWYLATFKWSDSGVHCTNLVLTDSEEKAEEYTSLRYKKLNNFLKKDSTKGLTPSGLSFLPPSPQDS